MSLRVKYTISLLVSAELEKHLMIKQKYFWDDIVIVYSLYKTGVDLQPGQVATGEGKFTRKIKVERTSVSNYWQE